MARVLGFIVAVMALLILMLCMGSLCAAAEAQLEQRRLLGDAEQICGCLFVLEDLVKMIFMRLRDRRALSCVCQAFYRWSNESLIDCLQEDFHCSLLAEAVLSASDRNIVVGPDAHFSYEFNERAIKETRDLAYRTIKQALLRINSFVVGNRRLPCLDALRCLNYYYESCVLSSPFEPLLLLLQRHPNRDKGLLHAIKPLLSTFGYVSHYFFLHLRTLEPPFDDIHNLGLYLLQNQILANFIEPEQPFMLTCLFKGDWQAIVHIWQSQRLRIKLPMHEASRAPAAVFVQCWCEHFSVSLHERAAFLLPLVILAQDVFEGDSLMPVKQGGICGSVRSFSFRAACNLHFKHSSASLLHFDGLCLALSYEASLRRAHLYAMVRLWASFLRFDASVVNKILRALPCIAVAESLEAVCFSMRETCMKAKGEPLIFEWLPFVLPLTSRDGRAKLMAALSTTNLYPKLTQLNQAFLESLEKLNLTDYVQELLIPLFKGSINEGLLENVFSQTFPYSFMRSLLVVFLEHGHLSADGKAPFFAMQIVQDHPEAVIDLRARALDHEEKVAALVVHLDTEAVLLYHEGEVLDLLIFSLVFKDNVKNLHAVLQRKFQNFIVKHARRLKHYILLAQSTS